MNVYARFYDGEAVVSTFDDLIDSLKDFGVPETYFDDRHIDDLYEYINSKNMHPKRFHISSRQFFILIKTTAADMAEFKANAKHKNEGSENVKKNDRVSALQEEKYGWYEASLIFKRVIYSERRARYIYVDTPFSVRLKANSPIDAYNRIVEHLQNRQDIDPRSQFPSAKGRCFEYKLLEEIKEKE
ncbi:MAG: hypothetical protein J6129_01170 [Bacteroidaceae bacterium]|nr:hypothetical protein [Bacteroidaceae bacterium]